MNLIEFKRFVVSEMEVFANILNLSPSDLDQYEGRPDRQLTSLVDKAAEVISDLKWQLEQKDNYINALQAPKTFLQKLKDLFNV